MPAKYIKILRSCVSKYIWYDPCIKNYIGYTFKVESEDDLYFFINTDDNISKIREKWWIGKTDIQLYLYKEDVIEISRKQKLERILNG